MTINSKGFTLLEMIIVMAVFVIVLAISGSSFNTVLTQTSKIFRSEESNIEGVVGLEMLRHDLQQAGFGLLSEASPVAYTGEATVAPASSYNDGTNGPPRPLIADNIAALTATADDDGKSYNIPAGTDYLVIKATSVGTNKVSQKWTYLKFDSSNVYPNIWPSASENFASGTGDKVVLLQRQIGPVTNTATLVPSAAQSFYYAYSNSAFSNFTSASSSVMIVYGVDTNNLRMPFNRTDYFVSVPVSKPDVCSKDANVGVLYKTTVNHSNGKLLYIPVLDCVADMQVVLGWDLKDSGGAAGNDGVIDTWSDAKGTQTTAAGSGSFASASDVQAALTSAVTIRNSLKMVKVYILAQNGKKDPTYTSPSPIVVGGAGETSLTRSYNLSSEMLNYRWKLYTIVARPKNLPANQ